MGEEEEEEKYEKDVFVQSPECLKYVGAERRSGLSYHLHFYNTCASELRANVCVEERDGKFRLYQTRTKIPKFGHYYINTFKSFNPKSVTWASDVSVPDLPENCKK